MRFQCNHCRALLELDDVAPGEVVQCPTCLSPVSIPDSVTSPRAVLGDFVIKAVIGNGGMGTVYLAHQVTLDRDVALKILHHDFAMDTVFIQNFINEARAAASLNHPNIVQAVAVNCDEGLWYFAMEYVNGSTLRQLLEQNGRIEEQQMVGIAREIVSALKYAWNEKHIVHRDIKPDNIMITADGHAKLSDLGLARKITELNEDGSTELYGTPQYIAPELLYGAPPNAASDIYSLGATLYHALSGRFPFTADSPEAVANLHLSAPLVPLIELVPGISTPLSRLIDVMMVKSPEDRYHDYDELEQDLRRIQAGEMPLRQLPDAQGAMMESTSSSTAKSGKVKLKFTRNSHHASRQENGGNEPNDVISNEAEKPKGTSRQEKGAPSPAVPPKTGGMLLIMFAILAIVIVAAVCGGVYFVRRGDHSTLSSSVDETIQSLKSEVITDNAAVEVAPSQETLQKADEEKAKAEAEEKRRQEAEVKAAGEKARQEAEQKAKREAEEKAKREAEEKAKREAEEKVRQEAEAKAAEEKTRQEAVVAEKAKRIETALHEVATRDFSGARQAFFSRIDHETPQDKAWREQWEKALTSAESFWEHLKTSAPKIVNSQVNEFSMKKPRLKFSKANHVELPWTVVAMNGDTIVLQREFDASGNDRPPVVIQWSRKLQDLRASQLEALVLIIGRPEGKSEEEARQAFGLYLLVCGAAPAKSVIEKYNLADDWPSIAESENLISPKSYIDNQLECFKERAETALNAKEPLMKTLFIIQAYDLGNALYVTYPAQKKLYAAEVQQIIKPLLSPNK